MGRPGRPRKKNSELRRYWREQKRRREHKQKFLEDMFPTVVFPRKIDLNKQFSKSLDSIKNV
jgi:hypothetical protein